MNKGRHLPGTLAFAIALALAAASCGSGNGNGWITPPGCDAVGQNCPSGFKCERGCEGMTAMMVCTVDDGSVGVGEFCSPEAHCAAGTTCALVGDRSIACTRYCASDADCLSGERCHTDITDLFCPGAASSPLVVHLCY